MEPDHSEVRSSRWLHHTRMFFFCCFSLFSFIIELATTTLDTGFLGRLCVR